MKLSIVVPAFNEERLLRATLDAIHAAARPLARDYEVIVCDNNSTDRTAAIARDAGAKVVFEPVNQISRARNRGAEAARGDWLLFVDADSSPSPALFADMLAAMESGGCIGGGTTVAFPGAERKARLFIALWNAMSRLAGWAAGSFIFCRAAAFRSLGGFSTRLYAAEELDFSRRIKRLGRFVILHRHPLATSDRKVRLYSWREHLGFLLRFALSGGRALRRREDCFVWYDGRR